MIDVSFRLINNDASIKQFILESMRDTLGFAFNKAYNKLSAKLQILLYETIINTPTMMSLMHGALRAELALEAPASELSQLVYY